MDTKSIKELLENQQEELTNIFKHEDSLLYELERYEKKIQDLGQANTSLDIAIFTVYRAHIKNMKYMLDNIHMYKNESPIENDNYTR